MKGMEIQKRVRETKGMGGKGEEDRVKQQRWGEPKNKKKVKPNKGENNEIR